MTLRHHADVTHYAILCAHRGVAYFAERTLEDAASRETTIADIMAGQVAGVEKVLAFNCAEHIADDVTEEIAIEIANRCGPEPISPALHAFIEDHAGPAFARGLAIAERTFAAA
ncbi:MAG TPA: hypothetical protein VLX44_10265 [Xanthobacteraceae bacterium]|nr:hypothetical protein [Xanthobacteraceae bacterium]